MTSPDEELEQLWREGLQALAPARAVADVDRIEYRRAMIRRRRAFAIAGITAAFVLLVAAVVWAAPGRPLHRVQTVVGPTTTTEGGSTSSSESNRVIGGTSSSTMSTTVPATTVPPTVSTAVPVATNPAASSPPTATPTTRLAPTTSPGPTTPTTRHTTTTTTVPQSTRVTVTLDDTGLHAPGGSFPPGNFTIRFLDRRTNPIGTATLDVSVQPNLGIVVNLAAGESKTVMLCPHQWYLGARIDGTLTHGASLDVSGTSPLCTTPIT